MKEVQCYAVLCCVVLCCAVLCCAWCYNSVTIVLVVFSIHGDTSAENGDYDNEVGTVTP
jgi:hypothetical protein